MIVPERQTDRQLKVEERQGAGVSCRDMYRQIVTVGGETDSDHCGEIDRQC